MLGASDEQMAFIYARAAANLLEVGPTQTPTRVKARRYLRLAIEHLGD